MDECPSPILLYWVGLGYEMPKDSSVKVSGCRKEKKAYEGKIKQLFCGSC
jgi:hypothetical protein